MMLETIKRSAVMGGDGRYRYLLLREWDASLPAATWVMLNPSTADAEVDDPTIRKCMKFSQRLGCGKMAVANLFAFRATDPNDLHDAEDPVGPDNVLWLERALVQATYRIAAWGEGIPKIRPGLKFCINSLFSWGYRSWMCLGENQSGMPKHPLYIRDDAPFVEWRGYVGQMIPANTPTACKD